MITQRIDTQSTYFSFARFSNNKKQLILKPLITGRVYGDRALVLIKI